MSLADDPGPLTEDWLRRREHEPDARFGWPSSYSLPAWELARHVRQLRRSGWQSWEVRVRFDFWHAA